jgi:hypothetical protein
MGRKSRITIVSIRSDGVCFYFVYSSLFDEKQGLLEGSSVFFMMVCESGFYGLGWLVDLCPQQNDG